MGNLLITRLANAIPRCCGSTEAAVSSNALILCRDAREAERLRREYEAEAMTISYPEQLRGRRVPMVVDVSALDPLAADAEARVAELEAERDRLRAALRDITLTPCYTMVTSGECACCRPVATIANEALAHDAGRGKG